MLMVMPRFQCRDFQMTDNQQLRKPDQDAFVFIVAFWSITELQNYKSISGISKKKL